MEIRGGEHDLNVEFYFLHVWGVWRVIGSAIEMCRFLRLSGGVELTPCGCMLGFFPNVFIGGCENRLGEGITIAFLLLC